MPNVVCLGSENTFSAVPEGKVLNIIHCNKKCFDDINRMLLVTNQFVPFNINMVPLATYRLSIQY